MNTLPWLILFTPLAIAALIFFFRIKNPLSGWLAIAGIFSGFLMTLALLAHHSSHHEVIESSIAWMAAGTTVEFGILLNGLSLLMLLIVTGVGTLIFLYSTSYMEHEKGYSRYFASLSLFAFSMLGIVLANNLLQIFIFWELVGVSSYLLIGFWFEKPEAATAGKKAFLTTRVGDVGMMIGILMLFGILSSQNMGTFNFLKLGEVLPGAVIAPGVLTAVCLLIFMGVAGKSAQLPLHVWLPDAMEGPTPVSALIHAATMVAAGVFLLARINFLFLASHDAQTVIAWIGGITSLVAGTIAIAQNDVKKVLAYSTLSQLGLMVMALGLGNAEAGMFHLTTHAFFKALLFLGSGSLIHAMHTQDIWHMTQEKGLLKAMPITGYTFLIGTAALMGIPPFSGFFSKEEIVGAAAHSSPGLFLISLIVVFCTAFYMSRMCTILFFRKAHSGHGHHAPHESGIKMTAPLMILSVFAVIAGFLPIKQLTGLAEHGAHAAHEGGHSPVLAFLSVGLALAGLSLGYILYRGKVSTEDEFKGGLEKLRTLLNNKYYFDDFYDNVVIKGIQENVAKFFSWFETNFVVEGGVNGTARLTQGAGDILRKLQTGSVQFYAFVFTAGIAGLVFWMMAVAK